MYHLKVDDHVLQQVAKKDTSEPNKNLILSMEEKLHQIREFQNMKTIKAILTLQVRT